MEKISNKSLERIKQGDVHYFYVSRQWKNKRLEVLERDHYECQRCLGKYKAKDVKHIRITRAVMVHHDIPLEQDVSRALDSDNLISLCFRCHEIVEGRESFGAVRKEPLTKEQW